MSNFKTGAGNLDFSSGNETDDNDEDETAAESTDHQVTATEESASAFSERSSIQEPKSVTTHSSAREYPYFVRRSNVGDERDTRLEIHVRDEVAKQEAKFRNELAEYLNTDEVSKTDAREFALLSAFRDPERVADQMREEGFGILD